jgi:hypothetical protein
MKAQSFAEEEEVDKIKIKTNSVKIGSVSVRTFGSLLLHALLTAGRDRIDVKVIRTA